ERPEPRLRRDLLDPPPPSLEREGGVSLDVAPAADEQDLDTSALRLEAACHDETVSPVVALPAEDQHALAWNGRELAGDETRGAGAGILHQARARDPELRDGAGVQRPHFSGREDGKHDSAFPRHQERRRLAQEGAQELRVDLTIRRPS